jgi:hypothetical protein
MSPTATAVDYDAAIAEAAEGERKADEKATELRSRQRALLRDSLSGVDVSSELGRIDRELDRLARQAERCRILVEEARAGKAEAGQRAQQEATARLRTELVSLEATRNERLTEVERLLQALHDELGTLRGLQVKILQARSSLGLALNLNLRSLLSDRASWMLGRSLGPAGLETSPLSAKARARLPLTDVLGAPAEGKS